MDLPDSYPMAFRRLQNLEKTLVKNPEIAKAYQETICKYLGEKLGKQKHLNLSGTYHI